MSILSHASTHKELVYDAYLLERELAEIIRNAKTEQRRKLYHSIYTEYYEKLPNHPFIDQNENEMKRSTLNQIMYLKQFLHSDFTFLEIGSGTGHLSFEVANYVKKVFMIDVSSEPTKKTRPLSNVQLIISDGVSIPISENCVNMAYSHQLMEHLHPEDGLEQLKDIYRVLVSRGKYVCVTPHFFSGPHDISKSFDKIATCLHIKEYTVTELCNLFKSAGFREVKYLMTFKGIQTSFPVFIIIIIEKILSKVSYSFRKKLARNLPLRLIFGIRLLGEK